MLSGLDHPGASRPRSPSELLKEVTELASQLRKLRKAEKEEESKQPSDKVIALYQEYIKNFHEFTFKIGISIRTEVEEKIAIDCLNRADKECKGKEETFASLLFDYILADLNLTPYDIIRASPHRTSTSASTSPYGTPTSVVKSGSSPLFTPRIVSKLQKKTELKGSSSSSASQAKDDSTPPLFPSTPSVFFKERERASSLPTAFAPTSSRTTRSTSLPPSSKPPTEPLPSPSPAPAPSIPRGIRKHVGIKAYNKIKNYRDKPYIEFKQRSGLEIFFTGRNHAGLFCIEMGKIGLQIGFVQKDNLHVDKSDFGKYFSSVQITNLNDVDRLCLEFLAIGSKNLEDLYEVCKVSRKPISKEKSEVDEASSEYQSTRSSEASFTM